METIINVISSGFSRLAKVRSVLAILAACATLPAFGGSVRDYGAKGDGQADDTAAIQAAITASSSGATIFFPAGIYRLTKAVSLASNRTYLGEPGAILKPPSGSFAAQTPYNQTENIIVNGLVFDGGGLNFRGTTTPAQKVRITRCRFQNILSATADWTVRNAIFIASGMSDSSIDTNSFYNIFEGGQYLATDSMANGIMAYRLNRTSITDNTFDSVNQGISAQFGRGGVYAGVVVARNTGVRVHRMGIELQGAGQTEGLLVEDNRFSDFLNPYYNSFGLSIVVDGGYNTVLRDNVVIGRPAPAAGNRYGFGIEIGGHNAVVDRNRIEGLFWYGISIGTAPGVAVRNNYLCGSKDTLRIATEKGPLNGVVENNTTELVCSSPTATNGSTPTSSPAPANPAPTIALSAPAGGAVVSGATELSAVVSGSAAGVRFLVDGAAVGAEITVAPYRMNFDFSVASPGTHTVAARLRTASGVQVTSQPVAVSVTQTRTAARGASSAARAR